MKEVKKTVLITGSTKGIGKAIAYRFAKEGYQVAINLRNCKLYEEGRVFAEELEKRSGEKCVCIKADVSKSQECKSLTEQVIAIFGKIDVLINNAGIMQYSLLHRMAEDDYHNIVACNQDSVFYMMKYVLKTMVKRKSGQIINVASMSGVTGSAGLSAYAATKGAVIAMTKSAAQELAPKKIRVNAVAPGMVTTAMTGFLSEDRIEKSNAMIPLGRFAEPEEVAHAVYWLASEEASYVTGHVLEINGGLK